MADAPQSYPKIAELAAQLVRRVDQADPTDRQRPNTDDVDPAPDSAPPASEDDRGDPTP